MNLIYKITLVLSTPSKSPRSFFSHQFENYILGPWEFLLKMPWVKETSKQKRKRKTDIGPMDTGPKRGKNTFQMAWNSQPQISWPNINLCRVKNGKQNLCLKIGPEIGLKAFFSGWFETSNCESLGQGKPNRKTISLGV